MGTRLGGVLGSSRRGGASRSAGWLLAAVALAVVPFGAVEPGFDRISTVSIAVIAMAIAWVSLNRAADHVVAWLTLALGMALSAYVVWQSTPGAAGILGHPAWSDLRDAPQTLSVDPSAGIAAIGLLVSPLLAFMAAVLVARRDRDGVRLVTGLAALGSVCALYGLVQFNLFPGQLLWIEKSAYLESLTTVFVNRNTAATFLGVTALLIAGLLIRFHGEIPRGRFFAYMMGRGGRFSPARPRIQLLALALVLVLVALFQTQSRAGLAATVVGFVVLMTLFAFALRPEKDADDSAPDVADPPFAKLRRWFVLGVGNGVILGAILLFADRTLLRAELLGLEDGRFCVYEGVLRAIADHPLFGSGFGTFPSLYPAYRSPECGLWGLWTRAHNSFLEGYVGLGLPFAAAVVLGYAVLVGRFVQGLKHRRRLKWAPAVGLAILTLVSIHSLLDFSLQIRGMAIFAAVALGACTGLSIRWTDRSAVADNDPSGPAALARSVVSGSLAVVTSLAAIVLVAQAGLAMILESRVTLLKAEYDRLSRAPKVSVADLSAAADRSTALLKATCNGDLRHLALDFQILRLQRTEVTVVTPLWLDFLGKAIPVADDVLACSPVDGRVWAQVALLRRAQGASPTAIAEALHQSSRYAPAELDAIRMRLAAVSSEPGPVRPEQREVATRDFNTVTRFLWPEGAAEILTSYYDSPPDALVDQVLPLPEERRRDLQRVGIDLTRLSGRAASQNQLTSPPGFGTLEGFTRTSPDIRPEP